MSIDPNDGLGVEPSKPDLAEDDAAVKPELHSTRLADRPPRPAADIRLDLDCALAYQARYQHRASSDRWVQMMRNDNEAEIKRLQAELAVVTKSESASTSNDEDGRDTVPDPDPDPDPAPGLCAAGEGNVDLEQQGEKTRWPRRSQGRSGPVDDIGL